MAHFPTLSRRALLAAIATLPVSACAADRDPPAPKVLRFREIRIDTGPFAAKGVSRYAARVADKLRVAAAAAFADRLAPGDAGAPILILEVSTVRLASWTGGKTSGFGFSRSLDPDEMSGALVLVSPRGGRIERRSHRVNGDPAAGGPWYVPESEDRRLDALCRLYAAWAVREYD